MERESMEFDVVIVGAGPAGLAAGCRLMQLANDDGKELSVCIVEKGSEVGAHILSGAILEPRALNELFPDWKARGAPLETPVSEDKTYLFKNENKSWELPNWLVPKTMHNSGNFIVSMGNVCRWLAQQAEELGVEIYPGFPASELIYNDDGSIGGVITGDMGLDENGEPKDSYTPGMALRAKYTVFAEGARGHLGKELIEQFGLDKDCSPQHYAIGFKEIWNIDPSKHQPGLVIHAAGWPLSESTGGSFLYHAENNQVFVGLIVDLNYRNPYLSPFDEFQKLKHQKQISHYLEGGERVSYGARAIAKGGLNSLPELTFPGGLLIGCNAGTLNFSKIKGNHTAMKSGMIAAETIFAELNKETPDSTPYQFMENMKSSWLYDELYKSRNFGAAIARFGTFLGGAFNTLEQNIFNGRLPGITFQDNERDFSKLVKAQNAVILDYPKPDGKLSFDKLSSVYLSNTNHEENQPCHLKLKDDSIPIKVNLPNFAEPAQRYCPAGVYEVIEEDSEKRFQINSQNCIHCKTCDIKDPSQNITWVTPEGMGGPNYPNM